MSKRIHIYRLLTKKLGQGLVLPWMVSGDRLREGLEAWGSEP